MALEMRMSEGMASDITVMMPKKTIKEMIASLINRMMEDGKLKV